MAVPCSGDCCSRESLKLVLDYLHNWQHGTIVERGPGEVLTRRDMHESIVRKARAEPDFYEELKANPLMVYMIALEEALGIEKLDYICQIREVRLLEETPEVLYLVLPTCHYGCKAEGVTEAPAESDGGTCHVCGMSLPDGANGCESKSAGEVGGAPSILSRESVDRWELEGLMIERVAKERKLRDALLFDPNNAYRQFITDLGLTDPPEYLESVRDIRIMPETDRSIFLVVPAEGQPIGTQSEWSAIAAAV